MKLHQALQVWLDDALRAPAWAGYALLALALAVTILGRHGQRLLSAALLGGGAFAAAFFGLRGLLHAWLPGVAAVIAGVLAALFGVVAGRWGAALVAAAVFAAGADAGARWLGIPEWGAVPPFAGLGLLAGMVNHRRVSVVLPPIFAALFAALGAAISWAPHWRGAVLWQLNDVDWVLGLWGALALVLLALALEREYRKRVRLAARTKQMEDEALKKQLEAKQAAYRRALDQLDAPAPPQSAEIRKLSK